MRHTDGHPLRARFEHLRDGAGSAQRRGLESERLVADLFRSAHFRVERGSRAARPRQTDLLATSMDATYLVECKWRKKKADSGDIDALRGRLGRTPGSVVGVLISMSGFTGDAIAEVEAYRRQPILLLGPEELDELMDGTAELRQTLTLKRERLLFDAQAHLVARQSDAPARHVPTGPVTAAADELLVDGARRPWATSRGGFGNLVFGTTLDVVWTAAVDRFRVDLDVRSIGTPEELEWAFAELAALGWTTGDGSWSLQQAETNWFGRGAATLLEALAARTERHRGAGRIHHTEQLTYVDRCTGGFWSLTN